MDYSILGSLLGSPYFGKLPYFESNPRYDEYLFCPSAALCFQAAVAAELVQQRKCVDKKALLGVSLMQDSANGNDGMMAS